MLLLRSCCRYVSELNDDQTLCIFVFYTISTGAYFDDDEENANEIFREKGRLFFAKLRSNRCFIIKICLKNHSTCFPASDFVLQLTGGFLRRMFAPKFRLYRTRKDNIEATSSVSCSKPEMRVSY